MASVVRMGRPHHNAMAAERGQAPDADGPSGAGEENGRLNEEAQDGHRVTLQGAYIGIRLQIPHLRAAFPHPSQGRYGVPQWASDPVLEGRVGAAPRAERRGSQRGARHMRRSESPWCAAATHLDRAVHRAREESLSVQSQALNRLRVPLEDGVLPQRHLWAIARSSPRPSEPSNPTAAPARGPVLDLVHAPHEDLRIGGFQRPDSRAVVRLPQRRITQAPDAVVPGVGPLRGGARGLLWASYRQEGPLVTVR